MVDEMLKRLERETNSMDTHQPSALFYQPRGYTSGTDTLQDEALKLAGWRNSAAEQGLRGYTYISLEKAVMSQPDMLIRSIFGKPGDSLAEHIQNHPALLHLMKQRPRMEIPYKYWICPGPMLVEAVTLLRNAKQKVH